MIESSIHSLLQPSNPFATHRVRPGKIGYRFEDGGSVDGFFARLCENRWRGQIVGPHGSGKSTLLKTLEPHWAEVGRTPMCFSLHNGQRRLPKINWSNCTKNSQMIIDGFEQLSYLQRLLLCLRCRAARCGLLVTTHRRVWGIPVVKTTAATRELVRALVDELVDEPFDGDLVDSCFQQAAGNLRETFMLLYDVA